MRRELCGLGSRPSRAPSSRACSRASTGAPTRRPRTTCVRAENGGGGERGASRSVSPWRNEPSRVCCRSWCVPKGDPGGTNHRGVCPDAAARRAVVWCGSCSFRRQRRRSRRSEMHPHLEARKSGGGRVGVVVVRSAARGVQVLPTGRRDPSSAESLARGTRPPRDGRRRRHDDERDGRTRRRPCCGWRRSGSSRGRRSRTRGGGSRRSRARSPSRPSSRRAPTSSSTRRAARRGSSRARRRRTGRAAARSRPSCRAASARRRCRDRQRAPPFITPAAHWKHDRGEGGCHISACRDGPPRYALMWPKAATCADVTAPPPAHLTGRDGRRE